MSNNYPKSEKIEVYDWSLEVDQDDFVLWEKEMKEGSNEDLD